jgi:hypothetical protein
MMIIEKDYCLCSFGIRFGKYVLLSKDKKGEIEISSQPYNKEINKD